MMTVMMVVACFLGPVRSQRSSPRIEAQKPGVPWLGGAWPRAYFMNRIGMLCYYYLGFSRMRSRRVPVLKVGVQGSNG